MIGLRSMRRWTGLALVAMAGGCGAEAGTAPPAGEVHYAFAAQISMSRLYLDGSRVTATSTDWPDSLWLGTLHDETAAALAQEVAALDGGGEPQGPGCGLADAGFVALYPLGEPEPGFLYDYDCVPPGLQTLDDIYSSVLAELMFCDMDEPSAGLYLDDFAAADPGCVPWMVNGD